MMQRFQPLADRNKPLGTVRLAFGCGEALGATILSLGREAELPRGALLWPLPGRDETTLLLAGRAQEAAYGREGALLVLTMIAPGEFYGSLMGGEGAGASQVEALADSRGAHFGTAAMLRLMETYSCVALAIARQLSQRLAAMRQRMVESALLSATGRIAAELLRQARASHDLTIRPLPVFAELAHQVQSTRETVSRTVSTLEKRGVVRRVADGLEVVAPHRLEEWVY